MTHLLPLLVPSRCRPSPLIVTLRSSPLAVPLHALQPPSPCSCSCCRCRAVVAAAAAVRLLLLSLPCGCCCCRCRAVAHFVRYRMGWRRRRRRRGGMTHLLPLLVPSRCRPSPLIVTLRSSPLAVPLHALQPPSPCSCCSCSCCCCRCRAVIAAAAAVQLLLLPLPCSCCCCCCCLAFVLASLVPSALR
jgi:hypothetical protein